MISFKQFLLAEVKRDNERAKRLADYMYRRQLRTSPENAYTGEFNAIDNKEQYPKVSSFHFVDSEEDYPIAQIHSKQGGVYLRRIKQYIDTPPPTKELPTIYDFPKKKGRVGWLGDGNHRTTIEKLRGNKTIRATVRRVIPDEDV